MLDIHVIPSVADPEREGALQLKIFIIAIFQNVIEGKTFALFPNKSNLFININFENTGVIFHDKTLQCERKYDILKIS